MASAPRSSLLLSATVVGALLAGSPATEAAALRPAVAAAVDLLLPSAPADAASDEDGIMEIRGSRSGRGGSTVRRLFRGDPSPQAPTVRPRTLPDTRDYRIGGNIYTTFAGAQLALATFVPDSLIDAFARDNYDEFIAKNRVVPENQALHDEMQKIVGWLLKHNPDIRGFEGWRLRVVHDPKTVNAWCMPGMQMAVFTGLLEHLGWDVELVAAVIAHEIAHAELGHGHSQIRQQLLANSAFTAVLGQTRTTKQTIAVALGGNALKSLTGAYFSREDEDEADERAVRILHAAGYDPNLLITALTKLDRGQGAASTGLWHSHPATRERLENIRRHISRL